MLRRRGIGKMAKVIKVLIVDDSSLLRERLKDALSEIDGIEIIGEAQDKYEAINSIGKLNPDVVILDIRMPKGNGFEVLHNVKKDRPSCVVIIFTNYPYPQYRKKCMEAGADFFFDKSMEFEKIPEVLGQLVLEAKMKDKKEK